MSNNQLYACFTMDCEELDAHQGGPVNWEMGERAMRGYCATLSDYGLTATLLVVPRAAERYRRTLLELNETGAELGLHFHPQDHGYSDFLGAYTAEEQERMLSAAANQWAQAAGSAPLVFRPGNFSANDATFPTLLQLGLLAGSVSTPMRSFIEVRANWVGAPLDPHFAHPANRLLSGDLPFLEVPITVDWESLMWGGKTPLELRIEMVDARAHGYTIRKAVERQLNSGIKSPTLMVITHNIFDYGDPTEFRRHVLDGIVREMQRAAEHHGLTLSPVTLLGLREHMLEPTKHNHTSP